MKVKKIQKTYTYQISEETYDEMIEYFKDKKRPKTPPYAAFQADEADTIVTLYESRKVVFQGVSADIDAKMWAEREKTLTGHYPKERKKENKREDTDTNDYYFVNTIGSDEVGTGDYFGPIVVTASYVNIKDINYLESLRVKDSKKLTDKRIMEIAPLLINKIDHKTIILKPSEYNDLYSKGINMNAIKALLHNKVLYELLNNNDYKYNYIVVDQFVYEKKYYEHISKEKNIVKGINFTPRAEDKCLSVAVSSIISRYIFLNEMKKIGNKYKQNMILGASNEVDDLGKKFVSLYGKDILTDICKLNFRNTDKILN